MFLCPSNSFFRSALLCVFFLYTPIVATPILLALKLDFPLFSDLSYYIVFLPAASIIVLFLLLGGCFVIIASLDRYLKVLYTSVFPLATFLGLIWAWCLVSEHILLFTSLLFLVFTMCCICCVVQSQISSIFPAEYRDPVWVHSGTLNEQDVPHKGVSP